MDNPNLYDDLLEGAEDASHGEIIDFLKGELPWLWGDHYRGYCEPYGDICIVQIGAFDYIMDDRSLLGFESRIIAAFGISIPNKTKRDDYRLRGWVGKTNEHFGPEWDKGHFIAHTIGGSVHHAELNVFKQLRSLNRGWSDEGKEYRKMEEYCKLNPGTFCFQRAIYEDDTANPVVCEFGLLTKEKTLWVKQFSNVISLA